MIEQNICLSGGAHGADLAWGAAAARRGDTVMHFSFRGHRSRAPRDALVRLTASTLREADPHLEHAARHLGRPWPPASAYAKALLRRDWFQAKDSEQLYAVASFRRDGHIAGGTAWAVTMFLDRHHWRACPAFFFRSGGRNMAPLDGRLGADHDAAAAPWPVGGDRHARAQRCRRCRDWAPVAGALKHQAATANLP